MKGGRLGTALGLAMVLVIIAATLTGLSYSSGSPAWVPDDADSGSLVDWLPEPSLEGGLVQFASLAELRDFLQTTPSYPGYYWYRQGFRNGGALLMADAFGASEATGVPYSTTNIQVEGVDEADIVKSDGEYLYLATDNRLVIVRAYPPERARVLCDLELEHQIEGLFVSGDRLAVLESGYEVDAAAISSAPYVYWDQYRDETSITVYDITNREKPDLERELTVDGYYVASRMIGDHVYLVASGSAWTGDNVTLPRISEDGDTVEMQSTDIWHAATPDSGYGFTTIASVNVADDKEEAAHETFLAGSASNVYVSPANIYITYPVWSEGSGRTSIHRIHIDRGRIEYQATGEVPGSLLNQFSMDEHGRYFRVATTVWDWQASTFESKQSSGVYVLDENLDIYGSLENLAPGEQIHSARFLGHRCYLVTFQKVDPLFVIDLADPAAPRVLGELKITGYSDYLHPYDEDHIIGIGKETAAAEEGNFAWYQGVKISLFDVSDVAHPMEVAKYEIGDRGTDSPVLYDHRAFLFDRAKGLLVLPVNVAEIDPAQYGADIPSWAYGETTWQGAYVFDISLDGGLELKGQITHCGEDTDSSARRTGLTWPSYGYSSCSIERSLYIGGVLYTISGAQIGMNDLQTLEEIGEISLS